MVTGAPMQAPWAARAADEYGESKLSLKFVEHMRADLDTHLPS